MELASEDSLRLHVLLRQPLQAVRIDESIPAVRALTEQGELSMPLHPSGQPERYLRAVREVLSSHVLGSPGGYPVYLQRWTRMGQARDASLARLLLLGEPEAVVAVVCAPGLDAELARRAWWSMPTADNARRMLERPAVAHSPLGPVLAEYLVEYLPFEEEPRAMLDSVRLVLQPGLIGPDARLRLWQRGRQKPVYYLGFLQADPDAFPEALAAHRDWEGLHTALGGLSAAGNPFALQLCRTFSPAGQTFLDAARQVLRKPANHEVVAGILNVLGGYFAACRPAQETRPVSIETALARAEAACDETDSSLAAVLAQRPALRPQLEALAALAQVDEALAVPILARTDAVGPLLGRKLAPLSTPLLGLFSRLQGALG